MEVSPQLQNQLAQYQQLQQQIQVILNQKFQLETQINEINNTLEELRNTPEENTIYKSIGSLLVKATDREALKKNLEEQKETISIRVKTLERQESHLRDRFQTLQEQLSQALKSSGSTG